MLLVGLCSYAYVVLHDIEKAAADATMNVRVVGEQFTWTFYYPGESGGKELVTNQLYLPVDTEVKFTVQSKDVLHDFFVPAFREKIDAVPGIDTTYSVEDDAGRQLPRGLRGAVRARALHDAPDGARAAQGRVRVVAERSSGRRRRSDGSVHRSEGRGSMTARLRGPGFARAGAFVLLGVLFSAALVIVVRELYGFDTFDGGTAPARRRTRS